MAQYNVLNLPGVHQAAQQANANSFNMERAQTAYDEQQKRDNTLFGYGVTKTLDDLYIAGEQSGNFDEYVAASQELAPEMIQRGIIEAPNYDPNAFPDIKALREMKAAFQAGAEGYMQQQRGGGQQRIKKSDLIPVAGENGATYSLAEDAVGQRVPERVALNSTPADVESFKYFTEGLPDDEVQQAKLIELGLEPRAATTFIERVVNNPGLAEDVGDAEATIAGRKKFGELTGAQRVKIIDSSFASIGSIRKNIINL